MTPCYPDAIRALAESLEDYADDYETFLNVLIADEAAKALRQFAEMLDAQEIKS